MSRDVPRALPGAAGRLCSVCASPVDMKNGMRNFPLSTLARRFCSVLPSKGRAPQTSTYSTTPRLCSQNQGHISNGGRDQERLWLTAVNVV